MTRDDAARIIKECKEKGFKYTFYTLNDYHTALDMAIEALEQEPCEDAISRQAAIDCLDGDITLSDNAYMNAYIVKGYIQATINAIKSLPSVSTEKTGHWVKSKDGYMRCDYCGSRGSAIKARFCHHCGAKMEV